MRRVIIGLALTLTGLVSAFPNDCDSCDAVADEIDHLLEESWAIANDTESGHREALDENPFLRRLSLKAEYESSVKRLKEIEASLKRLEASMEEQKKKLSSATEDERLRFEQTQTLVHSQRLLFEELGSHLARVAAKFEELDRRLDAHEMRLSGVEGRTKDLSEDIKILKSKVSAHAVDREELSYPAIQELTSAGAALVRSKLFRLPRAELKFEDKGFKNFQVTANASGNLFGVLSAKGSGGVVYDVSLTSMIFIVGPGARPLLDSKGNLNRDAAGFCSIGRTYSLKGFGSARVSKGLSVYFLKGDVETKMEVGRAVTLGAKNYSGLMLLERGTSYKDLQSHCGEFVKTYLDQTRLTEEIEAVTDVRSVPRHTCTTHLHCRGTIQSGWMKYSAVPQCIAQPGGDSLCEARFAQRGGTCLLPEERTFGRRLLCADGYSCDVETRRCIPNRVSADAIETLPIGEVKYMGQSALSPSTPQCPAGWRMPSAVEVGALAEWLRLQMREEALLQSIDKKVPAHEWFYPRSAYEGVLWTDTQWVYLLSNDSLTRHRGEVGVKGHLLCVR